MQNVIKLSAGVHELSCPQTFFADPVTLNFDLEILGFGAVVKGDVHAEFHRAECSGS